MTSLMTADVSDDVAQELQMLFDSQALTDVEEAVSSRPASLKDPGTPDQILHDQCHLTHFLSHPWCKVGDESRGRDSPIREQSNIDVFDGDPLQIGLSLLESSM